MEHSMCHSYKTVGWEIKDTLNQTFNKMMNRRSSFYRDNDSPSNVGTVDNF